MEPLARKLIQRRSIDQGSTTRLLVLPLPGCGLPDSLVDSGQPVHLDLLAGRPINLELDDEGLRVDLCFGGPPVRCHFPWFTVIAVQGSDDSLVETMTVAFALVMEDGSSRLVDPPTAPLEGSMSLPAPRPRMIAIPGQAESSVRARGAAKLRVVSRDDGDER